TEMKKLLLTFNLFLLSSLLFAQADLGLPSATGKGGVANGVAKDWECIGVNPANLGWESNHKFSISAVIIGISIQSSALNYSQLMNAYLHKSDGFSASEQRNFANTFTDKDGLKLQGNSDWFTFSLTFPKIGGFAMNVRDRLFATVHLNQNAADILFLGSNAPIFQTPSGYTQNMSTILNGTNVSYMHYREVNFDYGVKVLGIGGTKDSSAISIYAGIGFKYLWGLGNMNLSAENGQLTGNAAFSNSYGIDYGTIPSFTAQSATGIFPSVGTGSALDLGFGIGIGTKMKITFSATDIGQITWNKNTLTTQDALLPDTSKLNFHGINSFNIPKQASALLSDSGIVKVKQGTSYTTVLPSLYRMGIGYQFTKRFLMGADIVMPLNNHPENLQNAYYAVGAQVELAKNLILSFGLAGNSDYGLSIPLGVTLKHVFKIMEVGLATNNILPYITHENSPNISFARSFLRFDLDRKKK
ncbi:MAG: DUF5723 family protein, partial [Bacteroidia bacterium]